jgi:hypothetical protein
MIEYGLRHREVELINVSQQSTNSASKKKFGIDDNFLNSTGGRANEEEGATLNSSRRVIRHRGRRWSIDR